MLRRSLAVVLQWQPTIGAARPVQKRFIFCSSAHSKLNVLLRTRLDSSCGLRKPVIGCNPAKSFATNPQEDKDTDDPAKVLDDAINQVSPAEIKPIADEASLQQSKEPAGAAPRPSSEDSERLDPRVWPVAFSILITGCGTLVCKIILSNSCCRCGCGDATAAAVRS